MKAITKFLHEARVELAKVTWPTRKAAINLTLVVIAVSLLFMVYISGVDYGLTTGVKWLTNVAYQLKSKTTVTTDNPDVQVTPIANSTNQ